MGVNALVLAVPVAKLIWVFVEYETYDDYSTGLWGFDTVIGEPNLFIEMYVDICKIAVGVINMVTFSYLPQMMESVGNL